MDANEALRQLLYSDDATFEEGLELIRRHNRSWFKREPEDNIIWLDRFRSRKNRSKGTLPDPSSAA
ncbi:hypothetical protein ACP90_18985 [Labrenzia sp. CP4]|jgi:hypothetical protein|nr:hypothetical protein ACP90_18985 [Labrenzia sp. CP4]